MNLNSFLIIVINMFPALSQDVSFSSLSEPRIVGGYDCSDDYLFAVAIYNVNLCGGSLITSEWVITAGHCIRHHDIESGNTMLRTGYQHKKFVQQRTALYGVTHPKFDYSALVAYNEPELRYDIGLIVADKPFDLNKQVRAIKLPSPGFTKSCTTGTAVGIGLEEVRSYPFDKDKKLKCVSLPIVDHETCSQTWPESTIDDSIICTMSKKGGKDACQGDSGGPLVCQNVVIGLVSTGRGCARANMAATFTNVEFHLKWINKTVMTPLSRHNSGHNDSLGINNGNTVSANIIFSENILIITTILFLLAVQ